MKYKKMKMMKKILFASIVTIAFLLAIEVCFRIIEKDHFYGLKELKTQLLGFQYKIRENIRFEVVKRLVKKSDIVMCFGGSTTEGHTINPAYTYPAQLKKMADLQVVNYGRSGMICREIYEKMLLNKIAYTNCVPKWIIIHTGLNDTYQILTPPYKLDFLSRLNNTLYKYSALYHFFKKSMNQNIKSRIPDNLDEEIEQRFSIPLEKILKLCREMKINIILSTEPVNGMDKDFVYVHNMICDRMEEIAVKCGVPFIDFRYLKDNSVFMDDIHLNRKGNAILASEYFKVIEERQSPRAHQPQNTR